MVTVSTRITLKHKDTVSQRQNMKEKHTEMVLQQQLKYLRLNAKRNLKIHQII